MPGGPKPCHIDCQTKARFEAENARLRAALRLAMLHVDTMDVPDERLSVIEGALKETD